MAALSHVPVGALNLDHFGSVLPPENYERFLRTVQRGREVIDGNEDFFVLTKRIHNFLHGSSGDGGDLDDDARRVFDEVTERNAAEFRELIKPEDVVTVSYTHLTL